MLIKHTGFSFKAINAFEFYKLLQNIDNNATINFDKVSPKLLVHSTGTIFSLQSSVLNNNFSSTRKMFLMK